jgi:Mg-chelatase subunit ChlI
MNNFVKSNKLFIFVLIVITIASLFGKSIYKEKVQEIEQFKQKIAEKEQKIAVLTTGIFDEKTRYLELKQELIKLRESKSVEIEEGINSDGSSYKKTRIKTKKRIDSDQSNNIIAENNKSVKFKNEVKVENKETVKEKEINKKQEKEIKEIESGLKPLLYIAGGLALCILTGFCGVL